MNTEIEILVAKSVSGNISSEEQTKLEEWKSASETNLKIYNKTKVAWEKSSNHISTNNLRKDQLHVQNLITKQLQQNIINIKRRSFIYKIAAILLVPLSLTFSYYLYNFSHYNSANNTITEISSPKGNISKCVLPDGTEVWINTTTTISYNSNSFNKKNREIKLSGEAYFQVAKNEKKPFKVTTQWGSVNVTGTAFNVKSYPDSEFFETVLSEGSVVLNFSINQQNIELTPGEKALFNSKTKGIQISQVDTEMYSSWRNEQIIFKDATLNDLIDELERIYDIKFLLTDPQIGNYRFRGMFSYDNNLIDALEKIKKTAQLNYQIENKEVRLTKNTN